MRLRFVTGNPNKVAEVRPLVPEVEQFNLDLDEIQELDPRAIVEHKLRQARSQVDGWIAVEDVSLALDGLGGLPGPLIKWFLKTLGVSGLADLVQRTGNPQATARAIVGVLSADDQTHIFEGVVQGRIVSPRGASNFGWDPIFEPEGEQRTYAEMSRAEKNRTSHRARAWLQVGAFVRDRTA